MADKEPVLKVTLGLNLDGNAFSGWLDGRQAATGEICLGPIGFLNLAKTLFGLPQGTLSQGKRIAICLGKARKICRKDQPFFARSLEVAPWATARRLVQMLDCLHGAGWPTGGNNNGQPQRLAQLASLDGLLGPKFYPTPFWLDRLAELLDDFGLPQPLSVTMLEERDLWPCQWRKFFTALEKAGAVFGQWQLPKAGNGNTKLAFLQSFLQNSRQTCKEGTLSLPKLPGDKSKASKNFKSSDMSFVLLESDTIQEAAEHTALLLRQLSNTSKDNNKGESIVLLQTSNSPALDHALKLFHLPSTHAGQTSPNAGILQILPACLRLYWKPRSMQALLDFLLLEKAPVAKHVRRRLAHALGECPGIGNEYWNKAVEKCKEYLATPSAGASETETRDVDDKWREITDWILPEGFDEKSGLPGEQVILLCERLTTWAKRKAAIERTGGATSGKYMGKMLHTLALQCRELANIVTECGEKSIPRKLLEDTVVCHEKACQPSRDAFLVRGWVVANSGTQLPSFCYGRQIQFFVIWHLHRSMRMAFNPRGAEDGMVQIYSGQKGPELYSGCDYHQCHYAGP